MGVEEQKEEREVLDSIFPEEITDISETEYRISILLDVADAQDDEQAGPPTILLNVHYPPDYPDEAPRLDLAAPPNAPKYKWLDVQDDKGQLLQLLEPTIEENLGMAMVFTLVSTLKDAAETLIADRRKAVEAEREEKLKKAEEEENAKFHGTPVNRDTFLAWRENFIAEMQEKERRKQEEAHAEDKKKKAAKEDVRLTGRQLWERGLVGKVEDEEDETDGIEGIDKLKIEAA